MSIKTLITLRNSNKRKAILFIHGFGGDPIKTWGNLHNFVRDEMRLRDYDLYTMGYNSTLTPDLRGIWSCDASIEMLSMLLQTESTIAPLNKYSEINIIAHSMGGLIAQHAIVQQQILGEKAKNIFLFGTPSNGLKKALPIFWYKKQLEDLCSDSDFIVSLRREWKNNFSESINFNLWACAGDRDEFVPASSSLTPFNKNQQFVINGNHIQIVKPETKASMTTRFVMSKILGDSDEEGLLNENAILSELCQFEKIIQKCENKESELDQDSLISYALALENVGEIEKATRILEDNHRNRSDVLGTIGGRLKRMWQLEGIEKYAIQSYKYYELGYNSAKLNIDPVQMFYNKINLCFLKAAFFQDFVKSNEYATEVITICRKCSDSKWKFATLGEAFLHIDPSESLNYYKQCLDYLPTPREITSIFQQAEILCQHLGHKEIVNQIFDLFTTKIKEDG